MRLIELLILLPLAVAHAPVLRRHHAHAGRAAAPGAPTLIARAGAPIPNSTWDEISSSILLSSSMHESQVEAQSSVVPDSALATSVAPSAIATSSPAVTSTPASVPVSSATPTNPYSSAGSDGNVGQPSPAPLASSYDPAAQPQPSPSAALPSTLSQLPASASLSPTPLSSASKTTQSVVTVSRPDTSASAGANNSSTEKIAGLNKTTFIIIIVIAAVVVLAGIGWTVFRRYKLKPSNKFDSRMKPLNFSPKDADVFMEKTHHRNYSNSSAAVQRHNLVAELDNPQPRHVAGVPDHDFTAGAAMGNMAGAGAAGAGVYDTYNHDPYAHAAAYEYDPSYQYSQAQAHAHEQAYSQDPDPYAGYAPQQAAYDQPTQDSADGYADLHRGNSLGSGNGHTTYAYPQAHGDVQAQYQVDTFPSPEQYMGRPTGGSEGPYAQAAQYRNY